MKDTQGVKDPKDVPLKSGLDEVGILTLTLARPEKKNALDLVTLGLLAEALERARDDAAVRVVVLRAEGDTFSGGGDIQVMKEFAGDAQATLERLRGGLNRVVTLLHDLPKPVLCAVQGNAYGAGAILAFQCDLTVAAEEATFALSFRHVGLIPDTGGTWLLPRVVGLQKAKHLTWTGAPFTAKQAVEWGLILRAVQKGLVEGEVRTLAAALAEGPAATFALAKQALHLNLDAPLGAALDREARLQAAAFLTLEHAEGRDAFFARRKPDFRRSAPGDR
ncbi:MAG TPA: enoyl-CoA hydratase-related protein [Candidatus Thermoplasmatota archaeon]|nr:enoyl-CoA hydratase-related protein [Candidatus Thermoplasmatota archaeon]